MSRRLSHLIAYGKAALLATASVAVLMATPASADTAVMGYGKPGNQMNPAGLNLNLPFDPNGLSALSDTTRTPTGLLYPVPFLYPPMTQSTSDPDWWSLGWIEGGLIGSFGNTDSGDFLKYGDWTNGLLLTNTGFLAENRKTAFYISGLAENVGRNDQYYQIKAGRYGVFNITTFFDSIPHLYSTEVRSIWDGAGTGFLSLRGGLTPGASMPAQVADVAAAVAPSDLSVTREKAGASLIYTPYNDFEAVVQISNEWRTGTQPISATFGYPFQNGATQIIQPIHYRTLDATAALRYKGDELQANLTYVGSFFSNELLSLTWENPGLSSLAGPGVYIPLLGRLSLPPDNDYQTVKGDMSALLSPEVRFTASLSYSLMRQNDSLIPPTADSGIINGVSTSIDLSQWNTLSALSTLRPKAAIDLFNAFAQLQYTISSDLGLTFELRDRNEDNQTNYVAYNPLTGQYGYIAIDGGLAPFIPRLSGIYEPAVPGSVVQIRNMPFANDNLELSAKAAYRIDNHYKLDFSYVHNSIRHSVREVPDADDNRIRLQIATSGYSWGTIRASYEYAQLVGSDYNSNPYTSYYSAALPGYIPASPSGDPPFALSDLRKFDMADRAEHTAHAQGNYIVSPTADLQLTADMKVDDYDAKYGLRAATSFDVNAAFNYQLSLASTLTGFFSYQTRNRNVANINPNGGGTSGAAGSTAYPLANAWRETQGSNDYTAGLNAQHRLDDVTISANYTFVHDTSTLDYSYASTGAFFDILTQAQAGNAFPDISFNSHSLEANVLWQYSPVLTYRLFYQLSYQHLTDFHYTGLTSVISNNYYLGVVPENFTAQTVGLFIQYTF